MAINQSTITGHQDLETGLAYDNDGKVIVRDIEVPDGFEVHQIDQIGVYRRVVFTNGAVQVDQTEPVETTDSGRIGKGKTPLPGEQQDVSGTGQDAATQPKVAPSAKAGTPKTANK